MHNPTSGPVFRPPAVALRAKQPLPLRGKCRAVSPVTITLSSPFGPPFYPADSPIRPRIPQNAPRGRVSAGKGAPVRNPTTGPVFRQATSPARARILQVFSKGRIGSNAGAPVSNPAAPVPFRGQGLIKARPANIAGLTYSSTLIPAPQATATTIAYNTGATASAITATSVNLTIPAGVLAGDLMVMGVTVFTTDASSPPVSITGGPWTQVSVTTGTNPEVSTGAGVWSYDYAFVRTATGIDPGATITLSETGSGAGSTWWGVALASYTGAGSVDVAGGANAQGGGGTTVTCPAETTAAAGDWAVYAGGGAPGGGTTWTTPAGTTTRQSVVSAAGIGAVITDSNGSLPSGSSIGGGTFGSSNPAATVWLTAFTLGIEPQVTPGVAVTQASGFFTGRIGFSRGAPVSNPTSGVPAPALHSPVRARQPLPVRGRVSSNPGTLFIPVITPVVFKPYLVRVRPALPPRGRITSSAGTPASNPTTGPVFRQATGPARSRIPQVAARGVYAAFEPSPPVAPTGVITFNTGATASADHSGQRQPHHPVRGAQRRRDAPRGHLLHRGRHRPALSITGGTWTLIGVTTGTNPEVATAGTSIWSYDYAYCKIANGADPGAVITISETGSPSGTHLVGSRSCLLHRGSAKRHHRHRGRRERPGRHRDLRHLPRRDHRGQRRLGGLPRRRFPRHRVELHDPRRDHPALGDRLRRGRRRGHHRQQRRRGRCGNFYRRRAFRFHRVRCRLADRIHRRPGTRAAAGSRARSTPGSTRPGVPPGAPAAPWRTPTSGPPVYPLHGPVQAKALPLRRAICRAIRFAPQTGNPQPGPQFYPAVQPVAAKLPKPFLTGRTGKAQGTPPKNPTTGPVFRQATSPSRARQPLPRGAGSAATRVPPSVTPPRARFSGRQRSLYGPGSRSGGAAAS